METLKNLSEESVAEIQTAIENKVQAKVEIHVQKDEKTWRNTTLAIIWR